MRVVYGSIPSTNWKSFEESTPNDVLDRTTRGILQTDPEWLGDALTAGEVTAVEEAFGVRIGAPGDGGEELPEYPETVLVSKNLGDRPGFNTIQGAIDGTNPVNGASGATDDDTIVVESGTYEERPVIDETTGLTVRGTSRDGVVIDASNDEQFTNPYGFEVVADGTTLESFTLEGPVQPPDDDSYPASYFGLKISGCQNVRVADLTVTGSSLSQIDLNSVVGAELTNVVADGANGNADATGGTGVFLTNCVDVRLDGITTLNNVWGGIGVSAWSGEYPTPNPTARGIRLEGTNNIEDTPILYTEEQPKEQPFHGGENRGTPNSTDDDEEWDVSFPLDGAINQVTDAPVHDVTDATIDTGDTTGSLSSTLRYERADPPQIAELYYLTTEDAQLVADNLGEGYEVISVGELGSDFVAESMSTLE
jgi:hypothetical protein